MYCWYVRNTYLENKLREPGGTVQCGEPVDLGSIGVPTFLYASKEDHIVPWKSAYSTTRLLSGDITFVLGASGHIAGVINPPAKNKRSYWTLNRSAPEHDGGDDAGRVEHLDVDPDTWFERAEVNPGSWWPAWSTWLARHAGPMLDAPTGPGSPEHPAREDAPGSYVRMKSR